MGDAAAVHGLKGRRSNRSLSAEVRDVALSAAADPLYADFGPTLLAEHLERRFGLRLSAETLRCWMLEAGLWERRRKRAKHRRRRRRRAALGELGQWDGSVHPWLEERAGGSQTLISIHDDATSVTPPRTSLTLRPQVPWRVSRRYHSPSPPVSRGRPRGNSGSRRLVGSFHRWRPVPGGYQLQQGRR